MPFSITWHTILEELEEVPADATFVTPLSDRPFKLEDIQEHRLLNSYRDQNTTLPLKRSQFEQLYDRLNDAPCRQLVDVAVVTASRDPDDFDYFGATHRFVCIEQCFQQFRRCWR